MQPKFKDERALKMRNLVLITIFAVFSTISSFAQAPAATSAPSAEQPKVVATVKEADKDKLALLAAKRSLLEAQARLLQQDFEKKMQEASKNFQSLTDEFNKKVDEVFAELKLERAKHDINLETGAVTELPPAPEKK